MGKHTDFLYLNEEDMIRAGVLDFPRCIDVEEELFGILSRGDYVMGGAVRIIPSWAGRSPKQPQKQSMERAEAIRRTRL